MRALIFVFPQPSHYHAVAGFARKLRRAGATIELATQEVPFADQHVATTKAVAGGGLGAFTVLHPPAGSIKQVEDFYTRRWPGLGIRDWAARAQDWSIVREFWRGMAHQAAELIRQRQPDVVLVDSLAIWSAFGAFEAKVPCVQYAGASPRRFDPLVFPPHSTRCPTPADRVLMRPRLAWYWLFLRRLGLRLVRHLSLVPDPFMLFASDVGCVYTEMAAELGVARPFVPGDTCQCLNIDELVFAPREFEFARKQTRQLHWVGSHINWERPQPELHVPSGDGPLVYCSVGTQAERVSDARDWLQAMINGVCRNRDCRLLVSSGAVEPTELKYDHDRVVVEQYPPQLKALERSSLAILHGGFCSLREAAYFGVPMLIVPQRADQPRNGAMVKHLGLGEMLLPEGLSESRVAAVVRRLLEEPTYRERARAMRSAFERDEQTDNGVDLVMKAARSDSSEPTILTLAG